MSCNICHTPILVHSDFLNPRDPGTVTQDDHLEPILAKVCPPAGHQQYFKKVVQLDRRLEGVVLDGLVHAGRGVFMSTQFKICGGCANVVKQEEITQNGITAGCQNVAHEGCIKLLCAELGVPFDLSPSGRDTLIALTEVHEFLGTTAYGGYEGIDYSEGRLNERWLSQPSGNTTSNVFAFDFANGEEDWTMKRPDMFPRLHLTVKPERLDLCNNQHPSNDPLSTSPDLVFLGISKHLDLPDLYTLSTLNKTLRYRCLTTETFQNQVRNRIQKTWAAPLSSEYPHPLPQGYAHSSASGDWLLYGYHVFKTNSMRNRRRIVKLIQHLKEQYFIKAKEAGYIDGPNSIQMQRWFHANIDQQLLIHKVSEMYNFELFIKIMTTFNRAYTTDLTKQKFMGKKIPEAVEFVKELVRGKQSFGKRRPGREMEARMMDKIHERQKLCFEEKNKFAQPRRGEPPRIYAPEDPEWATNIARAMAGM